MSSSKLAYRTYNNARVRVILSITYALKAINSSSLLSRRHIYINKDELLIKVIKG